MKQVMYFITLSMLVLAIGACKKDKNDPPPPPPKVTLLVKEDFGFGVNQYTYDGNNRMISVTYTDATTASNNNVITITKYDDKGRVQEANIDNANGSLADTKEVNIFSADGKLERKDIYVKGTTGETLSSQIIYTYNGDKVDITRKTISTGAVLNYQGYTIDANGNAIQFRGFNAITGVAVTVNEYTSFDDKKNAYANIPRGWYEFSSKNNYLALKQTNLTTGAVLNRTFTYEYDADGFPTKRTTLGGTTTPVVTYTYEKK